MDIYRDRDSRGNSYRYTIINCVYCGEETRKRFGKRYENKITCGKPKCTARLAVEKTENHFDLKCVICGSNFKNPRRNARYCSEECRSKRYTNTCKQCGCDYRTKRKNTYLCSMDCKVKYLKSNIRTATCTECNTEFSRSASHVRTSGNVFCSKSCTNRYYAYQYYGEDSKYGKEWYHTRKNIFEFYEKMCQRCGITTDELAVHHVVPFRYISTESQVNNFELLIPLCYECHSDVHRENDEWFESSFGGKNI